MFDRLKNYTHTVTSTITKVSQPLLNGMKKTINVGLDISKKTIQFVGEQAPPIWSHCHEKILKPLLTKGQSCLQPKINQVYQKHLKENQTYQKFAEYVLRPSYFVLSNYAKLVFFGIKWITKWSYDKYNNLNTYKPKEPNQRLRQVNEFVQKKDQEIQQTIKQTYSNEKPEVAQQNIRKILQPILSKEKPQKGLDSVAMITGYLEKWKNQQKPLQKLNQVFPQITKDDEISDDEEPSATSTISDNKTSTSANPQEESPFTKQKQASSPTKTRYSPLSEILKDDSKGLSIKQCSFNHDSFADYSIEGKIQIQNKSHHSVNFVIPAGQIFGNDLSRKSQHVVSRQYKDIIHAKSSKVIKLQCFCGDSSLSWPRNDSRYHITSRKLNGFTKNLNQHEIWNKTN